MVFDLVGGGCDVDGMDGLPSECLAHLVLHHRRKAHQTSLHSVQAGGLEEFHNQFHQSHTQGDLAHSLADLGIVELVLGDVQIHNLADSGFHSMEESRTAVGRRSMEAVVGLAVHHRNAAECHMIGAEHCFENKGMVEVGIVGCIKYGPHRWVGMRLEGQMQDTHLAGYEGSIQNYLPATVRTVSQCAFWKMFRIPRTEPPVE